MTQAFQLIRGLVDGLWLGLASRRVLYGIDAAFYASQGQYVAEEYTRSGLTDWENAAVSEYFQHCTDIVVTGAGGGREVLALAGNGRRVTGFEPNEGMVTFGRTILEGRSDASLLVAPRDGWPALDATFDGAVIGWGSYTHIAGRRRRVDFLRQTRSHLVAGSPLLVSVYTRPSRTRYHRAVRWVAQPLRALRRGAPIDLGDGFAPMYAHHFTREELAAELADAGFRLEVWRPRPFAHAVAVAVDPLE
ncbi:class I SAM-dependent methyltransferase [Blastococcus colisei]|uniref:class I SAM-dependent methyltransferase n=1 Tax=Blastococcus colisei TaxID=1564162 RepID=UPI001476F58F|nr:class I SAM-dependent methyltransferase [Blastococcus colisei]